MATSVLHIKTEVECKVFLFDEEKGIALPGKFFNIEVCKGVQELLFIKTIDKNNQFYLTFLIEENDCDYTLNVNNNDFVLNTPDDNIITLAYKGNVSAQSEMGVRFYKGIGVKKDLKESLAWFRKAAIQGDVVAQSYLGFCYVEAIGVQRKMDEGIMLLKNASEHGHPRAQNALGYCYQQAWGVPCDLTKAAQLFRKSAIQGYAAGQINLAYCYENGVGIDKDHELAFAWMSRAALQGICRAQIAMGRYYEEGIGVAIDFEESIKWYDKAALKGDVRAVDGIKRVQKKKEENKQVSTQVTHDDYCDLILDEHNVYYASNGECLIECHGLNVKDYSVKEGCRIIKDRAFSYNIGVDRCSILTNLNLPNSVSHIGDNAFLGCGNLKSVVLQDGLVHIGDSAFELCGDLSSIIIPSSLVHLGSRAFFGCRSLTEIVLSSSLKEIEEMTFGACHSLSSISFPASITQIKDGAFTMCESLTNVILPRGLVYLGNKAFCHCENLATIFLPDSIDFVGEDVFRWCKQLREIKIPKGSRYKFESLLTEDLHCLLVETNTPRIIQENTLKSSLKKPYYLFFDTETTGIPKNYNAPASNTSNWPRLVQLGWILTDESGNEISSGNEIVKPEGFTIPSDASRVHGITTEVALREGKPLKQVIESFLKETVGIKCLVGHNVSFDQKVVGAELYRLGITDTVSTAKSLDTMKAATNYCKIPGTYGYKWPKLIELHRKLFDCDFEDAHDAMADITATKKCFFEMRRQQLI